MTPEERQELLSQSRKNEEILRELSKILKCKWEKVPDSINALLREKEQYEHLLKGEK